MANSVEIQLQKAIEMKEKTQEFSRILTRTMEELESMLEQFVRAGFPEDIAGTYYGGYYMPDRNIVDTLSNDIQTRHVDFLNRVIDDLKGAVDQK